MLSNLICYANYDLSDLLVKVAFLLYSRSLRCCIILNSGNSDCKKSQKTNRNNKTGPKIAKYEYNNPI